MDTQSVPSPFVPEAQPHTEKSKTHKSNKFINAIRNFFKGRTFLYIIIILELIAIIYLLNPISIYNNFQNKQAVASVGTLAQNIPSEEPVVAVVTDADKLRGENGIQAEIYKDAQNGDYVLGYTNRMIIYRQSSNKIIYDGGTPQMKLQDAQQGLVEQIVDVVKNAGLISRDATETPQVSVINDVVSLKKTDETFYVNVRNGDLLVLFPQNEVIVLYNVNTKEIINSGKYKTEIE